MTLTQFTAAEAERITGVSQVLQRKWRRAGYGLPKGEGWTRWDRDSLALLLVLGHLSRLVGPTAAAKMIGPNQATSATSAAALVAMAATKEPGAAVGVHAVHQPNLPRFAVSIGGEQLTFPRDVLTALTGVSEAAVVLDLVALGKELAARAGRELIVATETNAVEAPARNEPAK